MSIFFTAYGHPNITAQHRNTLEITRETELGKEGDCIIGVNAGFSPAAMRKFASENETARLELEAGEIKEEVRFKINKSFNDAHEIVIRKTGFISARTFGINADKAAKDLGRKFAEMLKKRTQIKVTISPA